MRLHLITSGNKLVKGFKTYDEAFRFKMKHPNIMQFCRFALITRISDKILLKF